MRGAGDMRGIGNRVQGIQGYKVCMNFYRSSLDSQIFLHFLMYFFARIS